MVKPVRQWACSAWFALGLVALVGCAGSGDPVPRADRIHDAVLTLDAHADITPDFATPEIDPLTEGPGQIDLPKLARGGLDAAVLAVFVLQGPTTPEGYAQAAAEADRSLAAIRRFARDVAPDRIGLATSADDTRRLVADGKAAILISVVNATSLGPDADRLDAFYDKGVRAVCFTHAGHNDFADSARPIADLGDGPARHGGLSDGGRDLVARLNRMGVIIDVSQISHDALMQVTALTTAPVVASHVAAGGLVDHPRNLSDEAMQAVAASGGVVHIVAFDPYLKERSPERSAAIRALIEQDPPTTDADRAAFAARRKEIDTLYPGASVKDLVDHIDYAVRLIGIDHVGIASDFNHGGGIAGWSDAGEARNVTRELVARGYSRQDIAKIWGGNYLRVFAEVEAAARR